jgi:hypothetical protein
VAGEILSYDSKLACEPAAKPADILNKPRRSTTDLVTLKHPERYDELVTEFR